MNDISLESINSKISKMETELKQLKEIRMVLNSDSPYKLLRHEFSYMKHQMRDDFPIFVAYKRSRYGVESTWNDMWYDVIDEIILKCSNGRTDNYKKLTFAEKIELRKCAKEYIDWFIRDIVNRAKNTSTNGR